MMIPFLNESKLWKANDLFVNCGEYILHLHVNKDGLETLKNPLILRDITLIEQTSLVFLHKPGKAIASTLPKS